MKKRAIALCMTAVLLTGAFAACGETPEKAEETAPVQTVSPEAGVTEEETESPTPHWDAVRKEDLGGITINITCRCAGDTDNGLEFLPIGIILITLY